jgi:hypothetical protein
MEKNVGGYDRKARLVLGPILVVVAVAAFVGLVTLASGFLGAVLIWAALLVGAVFIVTATTQTCPLNSVLGINTYRGEDDTHEEDTDAGAGRPT